MPGSGDDVRFQHDALEPVRRRRTESGTAYVWLAVPGCWRRKLDVQDWQEARHAGRLILFPWESAFLRLEPHCVPRQLSRTFTPPPECARVTTGVARGADLSPPMEAGFYAAH